MADLTQAENMHQCEVRQILRWRQEKGNAWVMGWLASPAVKPRRQRLEADAREQWRLGNRGAEGDWRAA